VVQNNQRRMAKLGFIMFAYKKNITAFVVLLILSAAYAADSAAAFDHSHRLWEKVLSTNVVDAGPASRVQYQVIKQTPGELLQYLSAVSSVTSMQFKQWNNAQKLAFLINAYNAFTIKLVIDHYPVKSIKDIGSWFSSPWKKKFFTLLGQEISLDHLEHEMIRGDRGFAEPRIHFALVCASIGCPKLQVRAFTEQRLEDMLEEGTTVFLNDTSRNRVSVTDQELQLSKIFDWYADDFVKQAGTVEKFVARYLILDENTKRLINAGNLDKTYLDYDWSLNDSKTP